MKKYIALILFMLIATHASMLLSGCSQTTNSVGSEQVYIPCNTQHAGFDTTCENADVLAEANVSGGIGGPMFECERHSSIFHSFNFFGYLAAGLCIEDVVAWEWPLRDQEAETGECLVNFFTFIQHFGIPREVFQELIDNNIWYYFQFGGETLDILYSGDWDLVDQFFRGGGQAGRDASERERRHWGEMIVNAQQIVYENTQEMSWYFHDVWTYFHFSGNIDMNHRWMRELIDAGEHDRVNIVEFINHARLYRQGLTPGKTAFEHWASERNLNIFTHYNFEVLLSGDMDLIREYYSVANQAAHTAQVQARFQQYVATHGYTPDTSWMIDRARPTPTPPPPGAPTITGPTTHELREGYSATNIPYFIVTGDPAPTVTLSYTHGESITWHDQHSRLNIAAGIPVGTYTIVLTAYNGVGDPATHTFILTVSPPPTPRPPGFPTITGPAAINLLVGQSAIIPFPGIRSTGSPSPTISVHHNISRPSNMPLTWYPASWCQQFERLTLYSTIPVGTHTITLTASNEHGVSDAYNLVVIVTAPASPVLNLDIFNNGMHGSPSRPNVHLDEGHNIRLWPQIGTTRVHLPMSTQVTAIDEYGNDAMEYVRKNQMFVAGQGWTDVFNYIEVNKTAQWHVITLTVTADGQTTTAILTNSMYVNPEPPPYFHARLFEEDWRPNVIVRFYHGDPRYTNAHRVPVDDIVLYVDGRRTNVRNFIYIPGHMRDVPSILIPRTTAWQEVIVVATAFGETIEVAFSR